MLYGFKQEHKKTFLLLQKKLVTHCHSVIEIVLGIKIPDFVSLTEYIVFLAYSLNPCEVPICSSLKWI
jgi:hypothetical protein